MRFAGFDARRFFHRADERRQFGFQPLEQFSERDELQRGEAAKFGFDDRLGRGFVAHPLGRHPLHDEQAEAVLVALHHAAKVADHIGVHIVARLDRNDAGFDLAAPSPFFARQIVEPAIDALVPALLFARKTNDLPAYPLLKLGQWTEEIDMLSPNIYIC